MTYLKKPNKINLDKSGPICILGKHFNLSNIVELDQVAKNEVSNRFSTSSFYDLGEVVDSPPKSFNKFSINATNYQANYLITDDEFSSLPLTPNTKSLGFIALSSSPPSRISRSQPKLKSDNNYYLIDDTFNDKLAQANMDQTKKSVEQEIHSRLWFTYRKDFDPLNSNPKYTSDCGWGCMLRSAQMLIAQGFLMHFFGKNWSLYKEHDTNVYKEIVSWFNDRPSSMCPFGIHQLLKIADEKSIGTPNPDYTSSNMTSKHINTRVGSWFGPTSACLLLREALNETKIDLLKEVRVYVAQDCTIYRQDVIEMCLKDGKFTPCIILISIRLGGEDLNEIYVPSLKFFLDMENCIGLIGGKPKHSLYFIGYQGEKVIYLDPHFCQPTIHVSSSRIQNYFSSSDSFDNRSFHCTSPSKTAFTKLDPSLAIGFYCDTINDFDKLCEHIKMVRMTLFFKF